jgi:anaerobic selenocysteine-containing dehydrogenase
MEHDDLYYGGAHGFIQVGPKLVEPPGQCRSNHEVLCGLAHRLGARHRGFEMTAYEMADATLRASGWPGADEVVAAKWIDVQPDYRACHFLDGFGHADKRFHFKADWSVFGGRHEAMPQLPDYFAVTDERTGALPFRLVAAPARQFLNTSFTEVAAGRKREGRPTALLHPDDAARLGVVAGGRVRLGNNLGEVVVHAAIAEGQLPGVVVVESIWPNDAFEGGIGINALISDEPAYPAGGAVFHDTAVWMEAVAAEVALPVAAE